MSVDVPREGGKVTDLWSRSPGQSFREERDALVKIRSVAEFCFWSESGGGEGV